MECEVKKIKATPTYGVAVPKVYFVVSLYLCFDYVNPVPLLYPFHIPLNFRGERVEHNAEKDCHSANDAEVYHLGGR